MATVTYPTHAAFAAPLQLPATTPIVKLEAVSQPQSAMHADDATALRLVSAIIFTVVALGTLAMLGTVLVCG
jgi:hypothetical protein